MKVSPLAAVVTATITALATAVTAAVATLALPFAAFAAGPELVTNGSFEANALSTGTYQIFGGTSVSGWIANDEIEIRNAVAGSAHDGNNYVELDANHNSSMVQTLATVADGAYTLSFWYSNRTGTPVASNGLSFDFGAGPMAAPTLAMNDTGGNVWNYFSTDFVAASNATRLTFAALGTGDTLGSSLDKISVTTAVPEPKSWALLLTGLAAVGWIGRRRGVAAIAQSPQLR